MSDGRPLLMGPTPIRDSWSNRVSLSRFLNALRAWASTSGVGASGGIGSESAMIGSSVSANEL
jgi:hypothetical protein